MALDKGGGSRGEGGPLADSVDSVPANPAANRIQLDYNPINTRKRLENRLALERQSTVDPSTIKRYLLRLVSNDSLLVSEIFNGAASDQQILIAKPYDLRRTPFDGETVGAFSYVYSSASARVRTNETTGEIAEQVIQEPYTINSDIIWAAEAVSTGVTGTSLIDLNISAKHWSTPGSAEINRYRLDTEAGDFLNCFLLDSAGVDTGSILVIAKTPLLRRTPFDGETFNGIDYVYTGNSARGATKGAASQNEIVIPPFIDGTSIIHAINVANNTGVEQPVDTQIQLMDINVDARLWARD